MSARALVLVAALVTAALAVPAAASAADIAVETAIAPRPLLFGAHAVARVVVIVDSDRVDVGSIRIAAPVAPLSTRSTTTRRRTAGGLVRVVLERSVLCDTNACLPGAKPAPLRLGAIRVTARSTDDRLLQARAAWPRLTIASRLTASDLVPTEPRFRVPGDLPASSYRAAPGPFARWLLAGGLLAIVAGVALAAPVLRRRTLPARELALESALRAVRGALNAEPPERRRALESLARALDERRGMDGGEAARVLAWAPPAPGAQEMAALADEVEGAEARA